ncbi:hypothetical protein NNJEOMEG_00050 [Fundidesulfovibrio magnetotacticus]|uniref:Uncharacterized protein n=1 Tax=Fundidesulfovibrio magnetotacticus TaxID=2730080 RepID=A0A6V8LPJ1_9BACT|nr:hypothetical protein [Fundidesulfovibrio magnetotacticus]GFK92228.1 hypothetical protein NNJEOMEG_00050 [Fundidesulfovibrio magnetotacticus]
MSSNNNSATVNVDELLEALKAKWPSTIVARSEFGHFSGGLISPKTCANADALGTGPAGRITASGKVAYPLESALEFLRGRLKPSTKDTAPAQEAAAKERARRKEAAHV